MFYGMFLVTFLKVMSALQNSVRITFRYTITYGGKVKVKNGVDYAQDEVLGDNVQGPCI